MVDALKQMTEIFKVAIQQGEDFILFLIDLRDFHSTHESIGTERAREILQTIALRLQTEVGSAGHSFWLGGDDFVVLSAQNNETSARKKIAHVFSQPIVVNGQNIKIDFRLGESYLPRDGTHPRSLIQKAKLNMSA